MLRNIHINISNGPLHKPTCPSGTLVKTNGTKSSLSHLMILLDGVLSGIEERSGSSFADVNTASSSDWW